MNIEYEIQGFGAACLFFVPISSNDKNNNKQKKNIICEKNRIR